MNPTHSDVLNEGQSASLERRFSSEDIYDWNQLCQLDGGWQGVPEPLIAGLFSCLLGKDLPGNGTIYLEQDMTFHNTANADENLRATVTVSRLRRNRTLVNLITQCTGRDNRLICDGEALVLFR